MGKASRNKRTGSARDRIAAQRAAARRAEVRNRVFLVSGSVVVVIAIVIVFVVVKLNKTPPKSTSNGPTGAALTAVVGNVTSVPAKTLDTVGAGSISSGPSPITGEALLTKDGKPELLYIGAEYCPYCAAERWAMIVALSRFGTFSGLKTVHSATRDAYSNTPTFTFYGSTYTSNTVSFVPVEETTNVPNGPSTYVPLQRPTAAEQALANKYDTNGSIPFIDIGNRYLEVGNLAPYGPQDLAGKTWNEIAAALSDPTNSIAQGIDGSANYLTAAICKLTNNQPGSACTSVVQGLEAKL